MQRQVSGALLNRLPVPLFGSSATAMNFSRRKVAAVPRYAAWSLPVIVGGLWFIWPSVDQEWKDTFWSAGKEDDNEEGEGEGEGKDELSKKEKSFIRAAEKGDFRAFQKDWETFQVKACVPGEDDDDEEEDEMYEEGDEKDAKLIAKELALQKAIEKGDFSGFQKDWDHFQVNACIPGEDDGDEDEENDYEEEVTTLMTMSG